jgi:hypothetical protein
MRKYPSFVCNLCMGQNAVDVHEITEAQVDHYNSTKTRKESRRERLERFDKEHPGFSRGSGIYFKQKVGLKYGKGCLS